MISVTLPIGVDRATLKVRKRKGDFENDKESAYNSVDSNFHACISRVFGKNDRKRLDGERGREDNAYFHAPLASGKL